MDSSSTGDSLLGLSLSVDSLLMVVYLLLCFLLVALNAIAIKVYQLVTKCMPVDDAPKQGRAPWDQTETSNDAFGVGQVPPERAQTPQ